jgi:hypothetical protein
MESLSKPARFSSDVYKLIKEKDMNYIDAVVHWCDVNMVDVELAASLIKRDPNLLCEIQLDAESLNYLKKTARLPI